MKRLLLHLALSFIVAGSINAQITLQHEFFNDDPDFAGILRTLYLTPDEMVYYSWNSQNIFLYDLEFNLFQTIDIVAPNVQYIDFISRELFDCDPDNIEYMVGSGPLGNSLIEIYRDDGTLVESIPYATMGFISPDYPHASARVIQNTPDGTKMILRVAEGEPWITSTRVYSLCGTYPTPCCTQESEGGMTGVPGGSTFRYSSASPNPANQETTIRLSSPLNEPGALRLFSQQGQMVKSIHVNTGQFEIIVPLNDLPAGTYLYRIETESGVKPTGKVVKI